MDLFIVKAKAVFQVLNINMARKFSRQVCSYMLVYTGYPGHSLPHTEIKWMQKEIQCHSDMS